MTAEQWIEAFAEALGRSAPGEDEVNAILELAATAAHASERTAAPIAAWLAGDQRQIAARGQRDRRASLGRRPGRVGQRARRADVGPPRVDVSAATIEAGCDEAGCVEAGRVGAQSWAA